MPAYVDEDCLDKFRSPGRCELCNAWVARRDPHHLMTRGAGRVDHPWNLIALCRACHGTCESVWQVQEKAFATVCRREAIRLPQIQQLVWDRRRGVIRPEEEYRT